MALTFWETVRGTRLADTATAFMNKNKNLETELSRLNGNLEKLMKTNEAKETRVPAVEGRMSDRFVPSIYDQVENSELEYAIDHDVDIVGTIFAEMESDGENESRKILARYLSGDAAERQLIDNVLVNLCGWSMSTLLKKAIENHEEEEDDE